MGNKVLVVGMGNLLREDDGVAFYLLEKLKVEEDVECLWTGTSLESYLGKIISMAPDVIFFVDAADFPGKPGDVRLLSPEEIDSFSFHTHGISLSSIVDYIMKFLNCKIFVIAIKPKSLKLKEGLSPDLSARLGEISKFLIFLIKKSLTN